MKSEKIDITDITTITDKLSKIDSEIRGTVERLHYSSPGFSAGKLRSTDGNLISFSGKIYVQQGDMVIFSGEWTTDPKWGRQFKVAEIKLDMELSTDGLIEYLTNTPEIKNIGEKRAKKLVDLYGDKLGEALINDPVTVAKCAKIPAEVINNLQTIWLARAEKNALLVWLSSFGLTNHQVNLIVDKLGNSAKSMLENNPYQMIGIITSFGFKRVDQIARLMGIPKEHEGRIRAGIMFCLSEEMNSGHTWTEYSEVVRLANNLLVMDCMDSQERINGQLDGLIKRGKLVSMIYEGLTVIGLPEALSAEEYIAGWLHDNGANPHFSGDSAGVITHLNEKQLEAFNSFRANQISLLTGGAGTGKTYTISTIVSHCLSSGLTVKMAAPTGKAARRMEQMVGGDVPAQTIHRLLAYNPQYHEFQHNEKNPIQTDVLIIDETSMLDIFLAQDLIKAISKNTAVLFVGDHNQLPPVGPGNILRDLFNSRIIPTTVLTTPCRQAGILDINSNMILCGSVAKTDTTQTPCPWHVIHKSTGGEVLYLLGNILVNGLERLGVKDPLKDLQILTPTHKGEMGTKSLNRLCQQIFQKKLYGVTVDPIPPEDEKKPLKFYRGDKVIQVKNDYDLGSCGGVMNGTLGIIREVVGSEYIVDFESEEGVVVQRSGNNLELAYALTIHKTQGSEFPVVISIIHKAHSYQHHRNLLYTAVTRARNISLIIGDPWGIKNCAEKIETGKRRTFLSLMLPEEVRK